MTQELKRKIKVLKRTTPEKVLEEIRKGNKFIVLEKDIDDIPQGYMLVDLKYKENSFKTLVPQQLMFFLANPGEGNIDEALDNVSDFYDDIKGFEDEEIEEGRTNVQDVNWATTAKNAYQIYLINKLTKNGKDFNEAILEELNLNDSYVEKRLKGIAAICLEKSSKELKKSDLGEILKHVTLDFGARENVTRQELHKVRCWAGSHYEVREEYRNVKRTETVTKHEEHPVLDRNISQLEQEIQNYRKDEGRNIGTHDSALTRQYINLAYIAKENPEAQLDIKPPGGIQNAE